MIVNLSYLPISGGTMQGKIRFGDGKMGIGLNGEGAVFALGKADDVNTGLSMSEYILLLQMGGDQISMGSPGFNLTNVDSISGAINDMEITGLKDPTDDNDAANKAYVDGQVGNINSLLDSISGEVV